MKEKIPRKESQERPWKFERVLRVFEFSIRRTEVRKENLENKILLDKGFGRQVEMLQNVGMSCLRCLIGGRKKNRNSILRFLNNLQEFTNLLQIKNNSQIIKFTRKKPPVPSKELISFEQGPVTAF